MIKKTNGDSEAVSPVVGVMLMLVVTIIIAAVVSAFAGGMVGDTKTAPMMMLDVNILTAAPGGMGGVQQAMTFEHLSGDSVPTKDLQIITYKINATDGNMTKRINDKNSPMYHSGDAPYDNDRRLPILNDMIKTGYAGNNPKADFGVFTLQTGDVMTVQGEVAIKQFLGCAILEGEIVDVKILHTPSQKYIYDKEVIVK